MRIMLTILADFFVAVAAIFGVYEYFSLRRHASFIVPFTEKMVQRGVVDAGRKDSLIREEQITHYVGIILCLAVCIMMSRFIAGISGYIVCVVVIAVSLIFIKPDMGETTTTRAAYYKSHKNDMDALQYRKYLIETGDIKE